MRKPSATITASTSPTIGPNSTNPTKRTARVTPATSTVDSPGACRFRPGRAPSSSALRRPRLRACGRRTSTHAADDVADRLVVPPRLGAATLTARVRISSRGRRSARPASRGRRTPARRRRRAPPSPPNRVTTPSTRPGGSSPARRLPACRGRRRHRLPRRTSPVDSDAPGRRPGRRGLEREARTGC